MGIDDREGLLERYRLLVGRVDAHARRVASAHAGQLRCRPGCAGCCRGGLTVSPIEAAAIARRVSSGPAPPVGERILTVLDEGRDDCLQLDAAGRCRIYAARPLVCRSHGLPLLFDVDGEQHGDACPLNFEDGLDAVPPGDFLNQDTVHTILAALNAAWCAVTGEDPGERRPLDEAAPRAVDSVE